MNNAEFKKQMDSLIEVFGPAEYQKRMPIIYELVSDLPEKNFAWIVKHFILTKSIKYPPLPEEFREAAAQQRKRIREDSFKKEFRENDEPESGGVVLKQFLERLGAKNAIEAMQKLKHK
jgi:hypothetical protein